MFTKTRADALLQHIDSLIEKYKEADTELTAELRAHRAALQAAIRRDNAIETSKAMLRIAAWVKFFYDHWPGD